jgi:hypothetical protein
MGPDAKRYKGRLGTLFIAGAIAVIAGLLFPLPAYILDVLLVFSMSLTAAVLIIAFSTRGALEIQSFPLLIVVVTTLRMALSVASGKVILSQGDASTVISLFGRFIVRNNCVLAISLFGIMAVVIFGTICKAVVGIRRTGTVFTAAIVPYKETSIETDLNTGLINDEQAIRLREKVACETKFFTAMVGAARFILCGAIIELVTIIFNIAGGTATGLAAPTTATMSAGFPFCEELPGGALKIYAASTVGAGMIMQISSLLTAVASRYIVRKISAAPPANVQPAEHEVKRIEVAAREVATHNAVELEDNNTINCGQAGVYSDAEPAEITAPPANSNIVTYEAATTEDVEWSDGPITDGDRRKDVSATESKYGCDKYYEAITKSIEDALADEVKTILMGAESVAKLPVTVPVNVAMCLARRNKKCLLIDLDVERGAVSKVFDVDNGSLSGNVQAKAIATCINNLWVWPGSNFHKGNGDPNVMNLKNVITALQSQYDCLIVYAPNIELPTDWEQAASCIAAAMLFGDPESEIENSCIADFHRLLTGCGCEVLTPVEVFAEVV